MQIKEIIKKESGLELLLFFSKNFKYFVGHFPQLPVLPGFVQVELALDLAKKYLKTNFDLSNLSNIKKLKFSKIIKPEKDISLRLEFDNASKIINFSYSFEEEIYSSGKFYFKERDDV